MSITLLKDLGDKSQNTQAVNTTLFSYSDIKLIQSLADKEFVNENIPKLFGAERKRVSEIFKKFNRYTLEECLKLAFVTGIIQDNTSSSYRDYIFKTAEKNIKIKLSYDREISKIIAKLPFELVTFFREAEKYHYNGEFLQLRTICKKIQETKSCTDFFENSVQHFKLEEENNKKYFLKHIENYYLNKTYLKGAKDIASYFENHEIVMSLYLIFHYRDDIEQAYINENFTDEELKILKILYFKGDIYDAEQKYNCYDFAEKFIQYMNAQTLQEALHRFLFHVSEAYGGYLEYVEQKLKKDCLEIIEPLFDLYDNDSSKLCKQKSNRLILESAIMSEYRKIHRNHEFKPYLDLVKRYSKDLKTDMVGLLTNTWQETPKQRLKRFHETTKALEVVKLKLGI